MNYSETVAAYIAELTNRQLLKDYRDVRDEYKHITQRISQGWKLILGEPINKTYQSNKAELLAHENELIKRGYVLTDIK